MHGKVSFWWIVLLVIWFASLTTKTFCWNHCKMNFPYRSFWVLYFFFWILWKPECDTPFVTSPDIPLHGIPMGRTQKTRSQCVAMIEETSLLASRGHWFSSPPWVSGNGSGLSVSAAPDWKRACPGKLAFGRCWQPPGRSCNVINLYYFIQHILFIVNLPLKHCLQHVKLSNSS